MAAGSAVASGADWQAMSQKTIHSSKETCFKTNVQVGSVRIPEILDTPVQV
jgi:hypothetical protein